MKSEAGALDSAKVCAVRGEDAGLLTAISDIDARTVVIHYNPETEPLSAPAKRHSSGMPPRRAIISVTMERSSRN